MKKCKKKKYEVGGPLDSVLPMLPVALGLVNPVLGTAASIGLKMSQQKETVPQPQSVINSNPYGFALGGTLNGNEDLMNFNGNTHAQGGIKVSPDGLPVNDSNQEIEGGETILSIGKKKYVFSAKLTI